jgi:hypothetical protein
MLLQLYELDPTVGQHIEYTFGDGIHNIPTSLYVLEKVQAEVFYHLSPSQVGQKNKTKQNKNTQLKYYYYSFSFATLCLTDF